MIAGLLALALVVSSSGSSGACYQPAVAAPVVDPFRPPSCEWCPGNRGVEYAPTPGAPVAAVAAGTVTFAGSVAGVVYVVVLGVDRRRVTYGRLADVAVGRGTAVLAGQLVGHTTGAFFLGVREGEVYVDPAPLLGRWQRHARLVPLDGTPARTGRPPTLACPALAQSGARNARLANRLAVRWVIDQPA